LVAGLRYDYHSSEDEFRGSARVSQEELAPLEYDETTINPRFSLKFTPDKYWTLRTSVGSGFRVPYGFSEDLHLCSGSPRVYKGGELKPEKSMSYSISADYTRRNLSASLNVYRTELTDAIAFADADEMVSDLGYTYEWQNIDDAFVMGVEFNGSMELAEDLVAGTRFEIFSGEYDNPREDWVGTEYEDESKYISRYPQTSAGLKMEYSPKDWTFTGDLDYKGKMYIDLAEPEDEADIQIFETESFVTLNARISKNIMKRYEVYVGARNLTDYIQKEKHISDAAFLYGPVYGRIVYAGIQITL
jgi:outer membrane receptor for ferrienterochelin and colicins